MKSLDETHDPQAQSWLTSANDPQGDFPPQNLPFCVFQRDQMPCLGVGIGDRVLCLNDLVEQGLIDEVASLAIVDHLDLSGIMSLEQATRQQLRASLFQMLTRDDSQLASDLGLRQQALLPMDSLTFMLPVQVPDYTDFYANLYHATNVGSMFRPDNPLLPNWKHLPIGYHGRASSLVISGTVIRRPSGQLPPGEGQSNPSFGPCRQLDYELEVGAYVGRSNDLGHPIPLSQAEEHLFGIGLVNDWSARDMQRWEYQPLGPFLAKSFATTLSPWVVTLEALTPFRCPLPPREPDDPQPLPYLTDSDNDASGGIDLQLEVWLRTDRMREERMEPAPLSSGCFRDMYWSLAQMLTHHSSNGCNMNTGDLIASGTVSGPQRQQRGCLLELTWDGEYGRPLPGTERTPLRLPSGEERTFLQDGDEVILRGYCQREGYRRIGLGECRGIVVG